MKIYIPQRAKEGREGRGEIGGGWSFTNNIQKALKGKVNFISRWQDCDIYFIPGATLAQRDEVYEVKKMGKKIVLRVDGVPEDWRNRGTGWPRLKDYSKIADAIIYQTRFVKNTVGVLLKKDGCVIYNGVDTDVFKKEGEKYPKFGNPAILNIHFRKDPNKRIEEVIMRFRELKTRESKATLTFIGRYPTYLAEWRFGMLDFKEGEDWQKLGVIEKREELAKILRSGDYFAFPSFADPCPNCLIEALACGLKSLWINEYGGAKEIIDNWDKRDWSLKEMGEEYLKVFIKTFL